MKHTLKASDEPLLEEFCDCVHSRLDEKNQFFDRSVFSTKAKCHLSSKANRHYLSPGARRIHMKLPNVYETFPVLMFSVPQGKAIPVTGLEGPQGC
jgi:hypothetical protein